MSQVDVAVIVGSLREKSLNLQLARALSGLARPDATLNFVRIDDLPLYDQDDDGSPASSVRRLREQIRAASAVCFVTPEYNRSIPGVLKNAIDHGSRPRGASVWDRKPAGILGISPEGTGTALAQQHLRCVLAALGMPTLPQPEMYVTATPGLFDSSGHPSDDLARQLQMWLKEFCGWIRQNQCALP